MFAKLFAPRNPAAARLLADRQEGAAWWRIHQMSNPLPPLPAPAAATRDAFLDPFLCHVARLNDFADKTTRSQTRTFWDLVCAQEASFWEEVHPDEAKEWPRGTWAQVRDAVFCIAPPVA